MADVPTSIKTWQMVAPCSKNKETGEVTQGKLEKTEIPVPALKDGEVLVEVAGCGVCHTDLGYFYDGVPTVSKPPLTLGHEISGTVVAGDPAWIGKEVIIPAVMPCRQCILCKTGRGNRCLAQKMPGNSLGIYGGFSSHIPVPSIDLCLVADKAGYQLEQLSVIADAVTTPYQASKRADLQPGDNVIVIGATGGVGVYMAQMVEGPRGEDGDRHREEPREAAEGPRVRLRPRDQHRGQGKQGRRRRMAELLQEQGSCQHGMEDLRGDGDEGRSGPRPRPPLLCRQTGSGGLRHGEERVHDVEAHGLRRGDHRDMGLPARILSRSSSTWC